jgi:hypothetical protein
MTGHGAPSFSALNLRSFFGSPTSPPGGPRGTSSKAGSKKNPAAPLAPSTTRRVRPPPHLRQHGLRPPAALRRKPRGICAATARRTPPFLGKLPNVEPLRVPSHKHGSIFSPHEPVDFCAPKRLVFGFAACGAWICRLRHLSFACAWWSRRWCGHTQWR